MRRIYIFFCGGKKHDTKTDSPTNIFDKGKTVSTGDAKYQKVMKILTPIIPVIVAIIGLIGILINSHQMAKATIEAARISIRDELNVGNALGSVTYRERSIYKSIEGAVKAYPHADGNGKNSFESTEDTEFIIDTAITNIYENTWYRLDSNVHAYPQSSSGEAFIYSKDVVYIKDAAKIEWIGNNIKDQQFLNGSFINLGGSIVSTNRMKKITISVYNGSELISRNEENLDNEYSYSMINSSFSNFLKPDILSIGDEWRLILTIEYLSEGDKRICSKEITSNFEIVPFLNSSEITNRTRSYELLCYEHAIYQGDGNNHTVKRYPRADGLTENTLDNYTTEQFAITAIVRNEAGHLWYQLDSNIHPYYGEVAFIYSGDVNFVESIEPE